MDREPTLGGEAGLLVEVEVDVRLCERQGNARQWKESFDSATSRSKDCKCDAWHSRRGRREKEFSLPLLVDGN